MEELRRRLRILGKRHSMEIIALLSRGPRYISQISEELKIPYATAQNRVMELERAGLVEVVDAVDEDSKRAVKLVKGVNFRLIISPRVIRELLMGERTPRIPHRPSMWTPSQQRVQRGGVDLE